MGPRRMREDISKIDASIARAVEYLGTHGASDQEVALVERVEATRQSGSSEEVLIALVNAGALQRCPMGFWQEVERAAVLVLPLHSPVIGPVERARRVQFHAWLQRRGKVDA